MPGYSLHIGVNSVDPSHYAGWQGQLISCEEDMNDLARMAKSLFYSEIYLLPSAQATRQSVHFRLQKLADRLIAGDILLVTYSGHGAQIPDLTNDEVEDTDDEAWCLKDGMLLDDELVLAWSKFSKGVRIVLISDSCHSGGMDVFSSISMLKIPFSELSHMSRSRITPNKIISKTYDNNQDFYKYIQHETSKQLNATSEVERNERVQCSVKVLAACNSMELAQESNENGYFTAALINAWNFGRFKGTYSDLKNDISDVLSRIGHISQSPRLKLIGQPSDLFDQKPIFVI